LSKPTSAEKHSAPGQAAGYFYQVERAMARLAESNPEAIVAVEKEDDVSVRLSDDRLILEQDKHTVNDSSPFTDGSHALWNTLDIWTTLAENNEISPENANYFLVTNVEIPPGLARTIGECDSSNVSQCLVSLKQKAGEITGDVRVKADRVIARDNSLLSDVLINISCVDSSASSAGPMLRRKVIGNLHLHPEVDGIDVLNGLHGWISNQLLEAWRAKKPGLISRASFDRQLHRICHNLRTFKKRFGFPKHLVDIANTDLNRYRKERFVKQLTLVTKNSDETLEAIDDFVCCSTERSRLAKEGDLTGDDWKDFDGNLFQSWQNIFRRETRLRAGEPEEDIGYGIFSYTRDKEFTLGEYTAHPYFVKGTYHRLADDKQLTLGWHPQFQSLIK